METAEWIAQAQARCDAASLGPWVEEREQGGDESGYDGSNYATGRVWGPPATDQQHGVDYDRDDDTVVTAELGRDAEFVAAARTDLPKALGALTAVLALADAYENYAVTCDRDAQTGSSDSPTRQHWRREADYARLAARRIRHALGD